MSRHLSAAKRVERGAAFLDERMPEWREFVSLQQLNLDSCESCVLGQLGGGSYIAGMKRFGIKNDKDQLRYGFEIYEDESYQDLQKEWEKYIP